LNQLSINNDKDVNLIIKYLVEKKIIKLPESPEQTIPPKPGIVMKLINMKTERDSCISDLKEIKNILLETIETIINESQKQITALNDNINVREYFILNHYRLAPPNNTSPETYNNNTSPETYKLSQIISNQSQLETDKKIYAKLIVTLGPYSNNINVIPLLDTLKTINTNLEGQKSILEGLYKQYTPTNTAIPI
jgi:ABC-type antimicrobial peptide transport system permease subunit